MNEDLNNNNLGEEAYIPIEQSSDNDFSQRQKVSPTPKSELDFNMMTTDTVYGQSFISPELKARLQKNHVVYDDNGKSYLKKSAFWEIHSYFTRDLRLGNLSDGKHFWQPNEVQIAKYHFDLAGDYLTYNSPYMPNGFIEPFLVHIRRVAGMIELSHSKNGWFRTKAGTYREERIPIRQGETEQKRNWLGFGKKQEQEEGQ